MDTYVLILTIVSSVLAILLIVLGVQIFITLRDARKTLTRVNSLIDVAEHTTLRVLVPLSNLGGMVQGVKSGLQVFESFVHYLKKHADEE